MNPCIYFVFYDDHCTYGDNTNDYIIPEDSLPCNGSFSDSDLILE